MGKMTPDVQKWLWDKFGHLWPDDPAQKPIMDEARNIAMNAPVWPGDTISHKTAQQCYERGWAIRDKKGYWIPTKDNPFSQPA